MEDSDNTDDGGRLSMKTGDTPRIVLGVSGTPSGSAALSYAVQVATERDATLELVRVWRDIDRLFSLTVDEARLLSDGQRTERELLEESRLAVSLASPGLRCTTEFLRGDLYADLLNRSEGADLLVLGAGDPEGTSHLVGEWFRRHATCPVALVDTEQVASR
jgi:nucleotide-binding universal stress UspA family protein